LVIACFQFDLKFLVNLAIFRRRETGRKKATQERGREAKHNRRGRKQNTAQEEGREANTH